MNYYDIIVLILCVVLGGFTTYFKCKDIMKKSLTELITEIATFKTLSGEGKMKWVVNQANIILPWVIKTFCDSDKIEKVAQEIYDKLKEFEKADIDIKKEGE